MLTKDDIIIPGACAYQDREKNFSIWIDGFIKYPFPHFTVYNDRSPEDATKVISFHIRDPYVISRGEVWAEPWIMSEDELNYLKNVLRKPFYDSQQNPTVWEVLLIKWNMEHIQTKYVEFLCTPMGEYFGKYLSKFTRKYDLNCCVSHTEPIPDWEYWRKL